MNQLQCVIPECFYRESRGITGFLLKTCRNDRGGGLEASYLAQGQAKRAHKFRQMVDRFTPKSPIGQKLLGQFEGEFVEVGTDKSFREYEILSVC